MENYLDLNAKAWDARALEHWESDFYDVKGWLAGKTSLKEMELEVLGDLAGKSLIHLQCHFGQDTLSLARMGARVTGVDLSATAIAKAKELAKLANLPATFVQSDLYASPTHIESEFDVVYSSFGAIGWLPDLSRWAQVVAKFLRPGGRFVFSEFHPALWMFDDDFKKITYSYFNRGPLEVEEGTYTDVKQERTHSMVVWNHSLAAVMRALMEQGLVVIDFQEFDYSPCGCFDDAQLKLDEQKFQIRGLEGKLPMVFRIVCEKPSER